MGEHARILVVDDDKSIRKTLEAILKGEGYYVQTAENGKQAIEKTSSSYYNLALIDIRLPDMEGTELLTRMKDTTPKMRKIIITGYPSLQNAVEALNREANAYILKPFDVKKVLETIREELKKQEAEKMFSRDRVAEFIETRVKELEPQKSTASLKSRRV
ncbi:MAG: response regulator [Candidatus Bathyarchaeia archaeon]